MLMSSQSSAFDNERVGTEAPQETHDTSHDIDPLPSPPMLRATSSLSKTKLPQQQQPASDGPPVARTGSRAASSKSPHYAAATFTTASKRHEADSSVVPLHPEDFKRSLRGTAPPLKKVSATLVSALKNDDAVVQPIALSSSPPPPRQQQRQQQQQQEVVQTSEGSKKKQTSMLSACVHVEEMPHAQSSSTSIPQPAPLTSSADAEENTSNRDVEGVHARELGSAAAPSAFFSAPSTSLVEAVLQEQLRPANSSDHPASSPQNIEPASAPHEDVPTVVEVLQDDTQARQQKVKAVRFATENKNAKDSNKRSIPQQQQQQRSVFVETETRRRSIQEELSSDDESAGAWNDLPPQQQQNEGEDTDGFFAFRLQPFPPSTSASTHISAALAEPLDPTDLEGCAGIVMDPVLFMPPARASSKYVEGKAIDGMSTMMTAAQAALAAERASLIQDSADTRMQSTLPAWQPSSSSSAYGGYSSAATRKRKGQPVGVRQDSTGMRGSSPAAAKPFSPISATAATAPDGISAVTSTITRDHIAEFLKIEADAEAAEASSGIVRAEADHAERARAVVGEKRTLSPSPTARRSPSAHARSSGEEKRAAQADSAAVLLELQAMQKKIQAREHGGRRSEGITALNTGDAPPAPPAALPLAPKSCPPHLAEAQQLNVDEQTYTTPQQQQQQQSEQKERSKGYASSPCDVSASSPAASSFSASASSSTLSTSTAASHFGTRSLLPGKKRSTSSPRRIDWTAASVTEIVDALDSGAPALAGARRRRVTSPSSSHHLPRHKNGRGHYTTTSALAGGDGGASSRANSGGKKRSGRPAASRHFDPEVYVHALLEGVVDSASESSDGNELLFSPTSSQSPQKNIGHTSKLGEDEAHDEAASLEHNNDPTTTSPLFALPSATQLKTKAVLHSGPTWAAAAAELGITTRQVEELLRYSLNAPEVAAWLTRDASSRRLVPSQNNHNNHNNSSRSADCRDGSTLPHAHRDGSAEEQVDERAMQTKSKQQRRRSSGPPSYALDAATQTALVHRIVSALPQIPDELKDELARQRRLLERVCREVSTVAAPLHAATLNRATTTPTIASVARQPPWIEFNTSEKKPFTRARFFPSATDLSMRQRSETTNANAGVAGDNEDDGEADQQREEDAVAAAQLFASLPRPAAQALAVAAGVHNVAADPTRPLPPFHAVVARPNLSLHPSSSSFSFSHPPHHERPPHDLRNTAENRRTVSSGEPYEVALHELAERETRHYVGELDRLRTVYDQQLTEERRQRRQEQQQYAALLDAQQQKMLRHHRETIHLLQREARLQQQELVAQRQQREHERTTRQMLSGAVEAMKSHCVPARQMDAVAGIRKHRGEGEGGEDAGGRRGGGANRKMSSPASTLARAQRIRQRSAEATAARDTAAVTDPGPQHSEVERSESTLAVAAAVPGAPSSILKSKSATTSASAAAAEFREEKAAGMQAAEDERPHVAEVPANAERTQTGRRHMVRIDEPSPSTPATATARSPAAQNEEGSVTADEEGDMSAQQETLLQRPLDADIPTSGHLTPLRHETSSPVASSGTAPPAETHPTSPSSLATLPARDMAAPHEQKASGSTATRMPSAAALTVSSLPSHDKKRKDSATRAPAAARKSEDAETPVKAARRAVTVTAASASSLSSTPAKRSNSKTPTTAEATLAKPSPSSSSEVAADTPGLQLNSPHVLRSVYGTAQMAASAALGDGKTATRPYPPQHYASPLSRQDAGNISQRTARMTLPLRVQLPLEDEYDTHARRVQEATAVVDARAAEAAQQAGLADGVKLYAVRASPTSATTARSRGVPRRAAEAHEEEEEHHFVPPGLAARLRRDGTPSLSNGVSRGRGRSTTPPHSRAAAGRGRGASGRRSSTRLSSHAQGRGRVGQKTSSHQQQQKQQRNCHSAHLSRAHSADGQLFDVEVVSMLSSNGEFPPQPAYQTSSAVTGPNGLQSLYGGYNDTTRAAFAPAIGYSEGWSERLPASHPSLHRDEQQQRSRMAEHQKTISTIAGRSCVGQPVLVLADPLLHASPHANPQSAVSKSLARSQAVTAQLSHAERQREQQVAALRDAAERHETQQQQQHNGALSPSFDGEQEGNGGDEMYEDDFNSSDSNSNSSSNSRKKKKNATTRRDAAQPFSATAYRIVGELPPCDAAFFGAPAADVLTEDAPTVNITFPYTHTNIHTNHESGNKKNDKDALRFSNDEAQLLQQQQCQQQVYNAFDNLLLPPSTDAGVNTDRMGFVTPSSCGRPAPTDYARAWEKYEAAANAVEKTARRLQAEDDGVLAAVAKEHHRRGGPAPTTSASARTPAHPAGDDYHVAVSLPQRASAAAGVRYREQQQQQQQQAQQGGVYVSERMADEARALIAARQRLAQIRACFVTPPRLSEDAFAMTSGSSIGGGDGGGLCGGAASVVVGSTAGRTADVQQNAALVRRLVDETVWSVLENQHRARHDPVRQVVDAMEHELLRLALKAELTEEAHTNASARPSSVNASTTTAMDAQLLQALAEATLSDAVEAALREKRNAEENNKHHHHDDGVPERTASSSAASESQETRVLTRALQRYADLHTPERQQQQQQQPRRRLAIEDNSFLDDPPLSVPQEHVTVPVVPSTAWLHDPQGPLLATPIPAGAAAAAASTPTSAQLPMLPDTDAAQLAVQQRRRSVESQPSEQHQQLQQQQQQQEEGGDGTFVTATIRLPIRHSVHDETPSSTGHHDQRSSSAAAAAAAGAGVGVVMGAAQEVRIVFDVSPVARQLLSPAAAPWRTVQNPPMQVEELPSRRMELEDRRDVIVEAEIVRVNDQQSSEKEKAAHLEKQEVEEVHGSDAVEGTKLLEGDAQDQNNAAGNDDVKVFEAALAGTRGEETKGEDAKPVVLSLPPPPPQQQLTTPLPPSQQQQQPQQLVAEESAADSTCRGGAWPLQTGYLPFTQPAQAPHPSVPFTSPLHATAAEGTQRTNAASTDVLFRVLFSTLRGQEQQMRASLIDREEEQRQSLQLLQSVQKPEAREKRTGQQVEILQSPSQSQQKQLQREMRTEAGRLADRVDTHAPRGQVESSAMSAVVSAAAAAAGEEVMNPQKPLAAALPLPPSSEPAAPPSPSVPLPRVRDPVMNAVLEWVYQFGSSQKTLHQQHYYQQQQKQLYASSSRRVEAEEEQRQWLAQDTSAGLVKELHSAAVTAAGWHDEAEHASNVAAGAGQAAHATSAGAPWVDRIADDATARTPSLGLDAATAVYAGNNNSNNHDDDKKHRSNRHHVRRPNDGVVRNSNDVAGYEGMRRYAAAAGSQPSSRNLGSEALSATPTSTTTTSTRSSSSSLLDSPSLPSSLHTQSSSASSSADKMNLQRGIERVRVPADGQAPPRVRPVLNAQQQASFTFHEANPRARDSVAKIAKTAAALRVHGRAGSVAASSDTATTRYTTTITTSTSHSASGHDDDRRQHNRSGEAQNAQATEHVAAAAAAGQQNHTNYDGRQSNHAIAQLRPDDEAALLPGSAAMSSHLLPQRVSTEVQAALNAALRSHRSAALLDPPPIDQHDDHEPPSTHNEHSTWQLGDWRNANASGMAVDQLTLWQEDSQYAVTLPARSADTTQVRSTPPRPSFPHERVLPEKERKEKERARRRMLSPPVQSPLKAGVVMLDDARQDGQTPQKQQRQHNVERQADASRVEIKTWASYSFTSTSTSSHGSDEAYEQRRHADMARRAEAVLPRSASATAPNSPPPPPPASTTRGAADLPFMSREEWSSALSGTSAQLSSRPQQQAPQRVDSSAQVQNLSTAAAGGSAEPPLTYAALQEAVKRVQAEYRGGGTYTT